MISMAIVWPFLAGLAVASVLWWIELTLVKREHAIDLDALQACARADLHLARERRIVLAGLPSGKWRCPHCRALLGVHGEKLVRAS